MDEVVNILKALSDETRLRIINLLYDEDVLCVCDIVETLNITQTKASRHLQYLKNAGLVKDKKHAQWTYYSLNKLENINFIESLVLESLRSLETFTEDITRKVEWLGSKKEKCEYKVEGRQQNEQ